jgi:hypothetical protein
LQNRNVLILADGIVAKHFINRILEEDLTSNNYHIVYVDESLKPDVTKERFYFYRFDPTSYSKLSKLFLKGFNQVVIVLRNRFDTLASYENIRKINKNASIVLYDRWDLEIDDKNYIKVDANEILANRLFDYIPNVPKIAQNVGLQQGEIMEVLVPFGSSYVYRHIGSIEQKNWKIAAIYRNNRLILPTPNLMIYPNDILLLIGEPEVLKQIFKSIKREIGQFPRPYGIDSYLFIDMQNSDMNEIKKLVLESIYVHEKLNNKRLIIRVVNPNDFETLNFIKSYDGGDIEVLIDYSYIDGKKIINQDLQSSKIGLFKVSNKEFNKRDLKEYLYRLNIPVLSISENSFNRCKEIGLIVKPDKILENISSTIFDIAIQLDLSISLYESISDESREDLKEIIEHFENLSTIFSKNLSINRIKGNIIRELLNKESIFLVFPFTKEVVTSSRLNIFCIDPYRLYDKLDRFHQIFIPPN